MRDAFATRDMGAVLRAYRYHPAHGHRALPQETVSRWLGTVTQSQLSRIESGRNKVDALDKLVHFAQALKMPPELLWFSLPETADVPAQRSTDVFALPDGPVVAATSMHTDSALADMLLRTLDQYSSTDNLVGPQSVLDLMPLQLRYVETLLADASGKDRQQLLYVGARYAEFAGWAYQDTGQLDSAMQMSSVALDYAQEASDDTLASYVLMRRSNIATDAKRSDLALRLADSALEQASQLPPGYRAVALRQRAHALAQLGEAKLCADAIDQAHVFAERRVADSEVDLTGYCTPEYIEMEAAHCWVELGQANEAINTLQDSLVRWKPEFRRDLGLCLARLAVAHATDGQVDNALIVADRALGIARETKSSRTEDQLAKIPGILAAIGADEQARRLERQVRSLRT
ncbi:helix-turn-helix domain-containing protein [Prauserella cavernicola]|uniref:Helix-turn-helix transcriptional regulator n=1 Tax=Prauserella cavernicola TaxID=2800127 RepID=A0A934V215_9PSEU|nr:helix-turn-helix transcriptional regulator [Prauserella cavernicola]MBK1784451.1 helix-turn-helix transcriptional regulator [Prauserella cavernicola]